jgi:SAM (Sterile alpha motif) domain-containing protein
LNIADWLSGLSLERYAEIFRDNAIEVEILPELSEADLEKLGVPLGHRKLGPTLHATAPFLHPTRACARRRDGREPPQH